MFVRDYDNRSDIEITLDDFIDASMDLKEQEVEGILEDAVKELKKRLYWYNILLTGIKEKKEER